MNADGLVSSLSDLDFNELMVAVRRENRRRSVAAIPDGELSRLAGAIKGKHDGRDVDLSEVPTSVLEKLVKANRATAEETAEYDKRVKFYERAFGIHKAELNEALDEGDKGHDSTPVDNLYRCAKCRKGLHDECSGHPCSCPDHRIEGFDKTLSRARPDDRHVFESGASSSGRKPPYHLIPDYALSRIAIRFKLGAEKYGQDNWRRGALDKEFILDRINHGIEHLVSLSKQVGYPQSVAADDDAAAVCLAAIFVMEHQNALIREGQSTAKTILQKQPREDIGSKKGTSSHNPELPKE